MSDETPTSSEGADGSGSEPDVARPAPSLTELIGTYLKISLLGFGGPNAHLALMLDEVVERKRWLTRERFLEIMALTNLLPGPNSSEVAIHVGYTQRGWPGALATGLTFLTPTFFMVTALASLYFRFGALPEVGLVFWGLQPVIVAIVLSAAWKIGRAGVKNQLQAVLAAAGAAVSLISGQAIIAAMALGGMTTWWMRRGDRRGPGPMSGAGGVSAATGDDASSASPGTRKNTAWFVLPQALTGLSLGALGSVFVTHLWIGAVLFGGGYVLVALLQPYAVEQYGWLTNAQFLDGVALTQVVPGPISTLSAFVGYAAAGVPGAVLGTLGIYLPAFASVLLVAPRLERLRRVDAVRHALEGVVAVVAGAVLGVGLSLLRDGITDPVGALLCAAALVLALWRKTPALWLVGGGLLAGMMRMVLS